MAGLSARMHVDRAWLAEGIEGASGACPVPTRLTGFLPNPASCALPCSRPQHPASELSWTQSSFEESGRREGEKEQIVSRKRGSERVGSGDARGERAERWWLGGGGACSRTCLLCRGRAGRGPQPAGPDSAEPRPPQAFTDGGPQHLEDPRLD